METSSAVTAFLAQAQARGLSHKTIDAYSWALRQITSETLPTEPAQVETILAQAIPRLASESLYDLWRVLRTFHRWARIRFDIPDPTSHVAAPRRAALLPRALSPANLRDLLEVCQSHRNRLLVLVPLDTGLRLAEIAGLRKDALGATVRVLGKGSKARAIPISPSLVAELRSIGDQDFLWTTSTATPMSISGIKSVYRRIFALAGVRGGPHALRHTFATEYLRAGGDLYRLSRILGHSNTRITERYLHLVAEDLIEEHRRISPALPYLAAGGFL